MPRIAKEIKAAIRKVFFHPFGYDLVPLKPQQTVKKPVPALGISEAGSQDVKAYVELFGEEAVSGRHFYNVGAEATFQHPAWTRINYPSQHYGSAQIDLPWDLMSELPMPVENGKAKVIFTRYTLEHVNNEAVEHFLSETHRALAEDGFLRLIVPDIDLYYAAYQLKDASFFYRAKHDLNIFPNEEFLANINQASFEQKFLWNFASSASTLHADGAPERISDDEFRRVFAELNFEQALDYCLSRCSLEVQRRHPENHINWLAAGKLESMVRKAGFSIVYRSGYGQSHCAVLRDTQLLEARQPEVGLFMEARK